VTRCAAAIAWSLVAALVLGGTAARAAEPIQDLAMDLRMIPLDGQVAPALALPALDGRRLALADFKGQVVLLYFWATW
jgi:cytochrome oxidase Cu insertion factor (SCO1/SenC/PrrC family)